MSVGSDDRDEPSGGAAPRRPAKPPAIQERVELTFDAEGPGLELEARRPARPAPAAEAAPPPPPEIPLGGPAPRAAKPIGAAEPPLPRPPRTYVEPTFERPPVVEAGMPPKIKAAIGVGLGLVVMALALIGTRHKVTPLEAAEARGEVYATTDRDLAKDFGYNHERATTAFAGHRVRITGDWARLRPDFGGHNAVQFTGTRTIMVDALISAPVYQMLAGQVPGGRLVLDCTVRGFDDDMVRLGDCALAEQ